MIIPARYLRIADTINGHLITAINVSDVEGVTYLCSDDRWDNGRFVIGVPSYDEYNVTFPFHPTYNKTRAFMTVSQMNTCNLINDSFKNNVRSVHLHQSQHNAYRVIPLGRIIATRNTWGKLVCIERTSDKKYKLTLECPDEMYTDHIVGGSTGVVFLDTPYYW